MKSLSQSFIGVLLIIFPTHYFKTIFCCGFTFDVCSNCTEYTDPLWYLGPLQLLHQGSQEGYTRDGDRRHHLETIRATVNEASFWRRREVGRPTWVWENQKQIPAKLHSLNQKRTKASSAIGMSLMKEFQRFHSQPPAHKQQWTNRAAGCTAIVYQNAIHSHRINNTDTLWIWVFKRAVKRRESYI